MVKKFHLITFLIALLLLVALTACGSSEPEPTATPIPEVVEEAVAEESEAVEEEVVEEEAEPAEEEAPEETAEEAPVVDLTADFVELVSENTGLTLSHPSDWVVEDSFMLMLASDESMMADNPELTSGAMFVAINGATEEYGTDDPVEILTLASSDFGFGENAVVSEVESLTIHDQEAAKVTVSGEGDDGTPITAVSYVIKNGEYATLVMGATPTASSEEYLPILEAIASSIEVGEPQFSLEDSLSMEEDADVEAEESEGEESDAEAIAVPDFPVPATFLWRIGGEGMSGALDGQFAALSGMDVGPGDILYVADNIHGIYSVLPDGELLPDVITHPDINNAADVHVGSDGLVYVAAWGSSQIYVFEPAVDGYNLVTQFGEEGNGPGQFALFSPQAVTVDFDGNIYVLDDNEDAAGEEMVRIQVFSPEGEYLREFPITEDFFAATDIEFGWGPDPDGNLYVLGFIGGYILQLSLETGEVQARIGEDALSFAGPQRFVKEGDNFYVSTWTPSGVMMLDADGNLVSQFGVEVDLDASHLAWPEGGFVQPIGVASDGFSVYSNDTNGDMTYITSFEMP